MQVFHSCFKQRLADSSYSKTESINDISKIDRDSISRDSDVFSWDNTHRFRILREFVKIIIRDLKKIKVIFWEIESTVIDILKRIRGIESFINDILERISDVVISTKWLIVIKQSQRKTYTRSLWDDLFAIAVIESRITKQCLSLSCMLTSDWIKKIAMLLTTERFLIDWVEIRAIMKRVTKRGKHKI